MIFIYHSAGIGMGVNSSVQLQTMLSQFGMLHLGNVTERTDSRVLYLKYSSIHETGKNLMAKESRATLACLYRTAGRFLCAATHIC